MNNRTLYFGSAAGTERGESFPFGDLQDREVVEAYASIVETSLQKLRATLQFALIEVIEFEESGDRRSSSVIFSNLPDLANSAIIKKHYDIIQQLKREPGMDWSTLSANEVQFGPVVFCVREPHGPAVDDAGVSPEAGESKWSKPDTAILSGSYRITEEPDEARVWAKLNAYAKRVAAILPGPTGVLHILVVPFSILDAEGRGKKVGAACILIDAPEALPDDVMQGIYAKAQLFWLRFYAAGRQVAVGATSS